MISPTSPRFRYSRLSSIIKLVAAAPLCLLSQQAMSTIVVDGTVGSGKYDVRPGSAASDYLARNGATLTLR